MDGWLTPCEFVKLANLAASEQKYGSAEQEPRVAAYPLFSSMTTRTCRAPEGGALLRVGAPGGRGVGWGVTGAGVGVGVGVGSSVLAGVPVAVEFGAGVGVG